MTRQDHESGPRGYYANSNWPVEYGGVRRQKHARSPGLDIRPGEKLRATTRQFAPGEWVVATFDADGRLYVGGCSVPFQPDVSIGWLEEIDPVSLETLRRSPDLPTGGHNWCGGMAVLADGAILTGFGRYVHRLDLDLQLVAELELPVDHAHNGMLLLSDGLMITRNLEHDPGRRSVFTIFDPATMKIVDVVEFVGASIGRFCIDPTAGGDLVYATTPTDIHRLVYRNQTLTLDDTWGASYDIAGEDQGFAWCNTVGSGSVWFMDMGDQPEMAGIMRAYPVGTQSPSLSQRQQAPVRVHRVSTRDSRSRDALVPFGLPAGGHAASPLYAQDERILLAFDSANGKTGAWRFHGPGHFEELWVHDISNSNQPLYYPDTREVVLDDVLTDRSVDSVVVDLVSGEVKGRVATQTRRGAAMAPTPGLRRDYYAGSGIHGALYRVSVE